VSGWQALFQASGEDEMSDARGMDRRLRARLRPWELFGLALGLCLLGAFIWVHQELQIVPYDLGNYLAAGRGDFSYYYYAYWMVPLFSLLARLPMAVVYALWGGLNIGCLFFAGRVFGGRVALTLVGFQALYVVFIGQATGLVLAGLALLWWGMAHRRWHVAGLGLILAIAKFQLGLPLGLVLWLLAPVTWRERLRVLLVPALVSLLSLLPYPGWPLRVLETVRSNPANDWGSISLWRWLGPGALLVWLPPSLLALSRTKRIVALTAATALGMPYFQQTDLLALFVLPGGWLPVVLGNLGYLFFAIYWSALRLLVVVPLMVYIWVVGRGAVDWMRGLRSRQRGGRNARLRPGAIPPENGEAASQD
jgi:hypothetical protein